jgi:predicted nucleotidyltransferase
VRIFSVDPVKVREALRALVESRYRPDPRLLAAILFGSFARGDATPGSDIDLLLVLESDPRLPRDRIPDFLPTGLPAGVDVIPLTRSELYERLAAGDAFLARVLSEGEVLFDREGVLPTR